MHLSEKNTNIIGLNMRDLSLCWASGIKDSTEKALAWLELKVFPGKQKKDTDRNLHPITLVLMVSRVQ